MREQHLLRKRDNPLFDGIVADDDLDRARLEDQRAAERFMEDFRRLVQRAVDLPDNAPSETVLELKEALDRSYQLACALPGDQTEIKNAIRKLVGLIMQSVRSGAGDDDYALRQLDEEEIARQAHFQLQEFPLVAALTHPDSPVEADELIPALLSETPAGLAAALELFDAAQLAVIAADARRFLEDRDPEGALADAWKALAMIEAFRAAPGNDE